MTTEISARLAEMTTQRVAAGSASIIESAIWPIACTVGYQVESSAR